MPKNPTSNINRLAFVLAFFVLRVRRVVRRWEVFLGWILLDFPGNSLARTTKPRRAVTVYDIHMKS
jgi:hypothetical protein